MKTSDADILIVPGFGDSGPEHWQSRWEAKLSTARRVTMPDWHRAEAGQWSGAIAEAVARATRPVVLIAHSLGVISIAHAASRFEGRVAGAFLVAPTNIERENLTAGISRDFLPLPREPFTFPSLLIASRSDPYCDFEVAADMANAWGSALVDAGEAGHINVDSGHGPWPEGLFRLGAFLKRLPTP